eukprot:13160365-Alexandrium_andersonii.AAC.1
MCLTPETAGPSLRQCERRPSTRSPVNAGSSPGPKVNEDEAPHGEATVSGGCKAARGLLTVADVGVAGSAAPRVEPTVL